MDEEELMDVLTAEIDVIYQHQTFGGRKSENPHLILSECEGLCMAGATATIAAALYIYVSRMIACAATGPAYGVCAGAATLGKAATLTAAGIRLYQCINGCPVKTISDV